MTALTAEDRGRFGFLFERLQGNEAGPDLETVLERCKAAGVPLERLSDYLLSELAIASNPPTLVALKSIKDRLDEGVKRLGQARRLLGRMPTPLGSPVGRAHPEALVEILEAVEGELPRAQELARQMLAGRRAVEARNGAKNTGRPLQPRLDFAELRVSRDDVRRLRRAVRVAARLAPMRFGGDITLTRVPDDRCAACGNPAARLFLRRD